MTKVESCHSTVIEKDPNCVFFDDENIVENSSDINSDYRTDYRTLDGDINEDDEEYDPDSDESFSDSLDGEITDTESKPDELDASIFAQSIVDQIYLGNEEVESTDKRGVTRFVPITRKDGSNMYIVMKDMKNQLYIKKTTIKYPSGKTYDSYTARVKPDYDIEDGEVERPENPKKKFMVDMFNTIKRSLVDQIKGYVKIPKYDDQKQYNLSIRHRFNKFYTVIGYQDKVYSFQRGLLSHILRDCTQNYVIHLAGLRITDTYVMLVMRFCRSVIPDEITEQLRFHDAKVGVSKVINYKTTKNINKLRYGGKINLAHKRYVRKADVKKKLTSHVIETISV